MQKKSVSPIGFIPFFLFYVAVLLITIGTILITTEKTGSIEIIGLTAIAVAMVVALVGAIIAVVALKKKKLFGDELTAKITYKAGFFALFSLIITSMLGLSVINILFFLDPNLKLVLVLISLAISPCIAILVYIKTALKMLKNGDVD